MGIENIERNCATCDFKRRGPVTINDAVTVGDYCAITTRVTTPFPINNCPMYDEAFSAKLDRLNRRKVITLSSS